MELEIFPKIHILNITQCLGNSIIVTKHARGRREHNESETAFEFQSYLYLKTHTLQYYTPMETFVQDLS